MTSRIRHPRSGYVASTVTILGLSCLQLAAAGSWPLAKLLSHHEHVLNEAPVSGGYIIGLQVINTNSSHVDSLTWLSRLFVPLRPHERRDLCLQVSRRDGSYVGTFQYQLPPTVTKTYAELDIAAAAKSKYHHYYHNVSPIGLATVASVGLCSADNTALIPVFWNSPPVKSVARTLVVAVQSGGSNATLYWGGKAKSHGGLACHGINQPGVARFDSLCERQVTGEIIKHKTLVQLETCSFGDCGIVQDTEVER